MSLTKYPRGLQQSDRRILNSVKVIWSTQKGKILDAYYKFGRAQIRPRGGSQKKTNKESEGASESNTTETKDSKEAGRRKLLKKKTTRKPKNHDGRNQS